MTRYNGYHYYLEEELHRAWGRKPDIVYIAEGKIRGYLGIEALLCSRTLTGSDQDVR
jgi:hypothetical protein